MELIEEFKTFIQNTLPSFYVQVSKHKQWLGDDDYLKIVIAASNYEINNVSGQYIQDVSLMYDLKTEELTIQLFGGNGGQCIYIKPQKNLYLYMERVKIPFRKVRGKNSALKALKKFCINYKQALIENKDILMYQDKINYNELLN
jgi:hypothetical protein